MSLMVNRILPRRKIVGQLLKAFDAHRLVVVVAPMGYGKTTVARQLADKTVSTTFYFAVHANSGDAESLWGSLARELSVQGMKNAPALQRMGFPKSPAQKARAIEVLSGDSPAVLIIDDYHRCTDSAMDVFLETLARHGNGNLRILILSRTVPEMNMAEMLFDGTTAVYDQDLLAFTEFDAKEYFFINGVKDDTVAKKAWEYSEGWATALWLCLRNFGYANHLPPEKDIEPLLDKVVFSAYTRAEQALLMQLSILDFFTPAEAEVLTDDRGARQRIHRIRNKNAFLTRDVVRHRYQFHSLFKAFLHKKLEAEPELNTPALYRRAAECHAARREFMAAYRLLVTAGGPEDSARLLELLASQSGESMPDCHWEEIHRIVQTIPWRIRLQQPWGYLAYLWLYMSMDGENFDSRLVDEAERRFNRSKIMSAKLKRRLAGELEFIRGALAFNDYATVFKHYVRAYELLDGPSFMSYKRLSWSFSSPFINFVTHRKPGQLHLLEDLTWEHYEKSLVMTADSTAGNHLLVAAERHLERGEFDDAERLLADVDELIDEREHITSFLVASFSRARLLMAKGNPAGAVKLLRNSAPRIEKTGMFEHIQCHDLALGYVLASLGRTDGLPRWLADGDLMVSPYNAVHVQSLSHTIYGKILLARRDYDGLEKLISSSPDGFGPFETPFSAIHVKIFAALLARRRHDFVAALESLRAALELSRPDGILLTYAEYGEKILPLLRRLGRMHPDDDYLRELVTFCGYANRAIDGSRYQKTLLSPREKKIMRFVSAGKTTPAIARNLNVSGATVKKALSQIYSKLGAGNRAEAAARFEAMHGEKAPRGSANGGASTTRSISARVCTPPDAQRDSPLAKYSPEDRLFLMQLSVIKEFTVEEGVELLGEAASSARIADLCDGGILCCDAETGRYRFSHSIREYLAEELSVAVDINLPALHRGAGECCVKRGELGEAFAHFHSAGEDGDLTRALELFLMPGAESTPAFGAEETFDVIQTFPWNVRLERPLAYLAFLWRTLASGTAAKVVRRLLDEAESRFSQSKNISPALAASLKGEATLLRGRLFFNDMNALWDKYEQARAIIKGPSRLFSSGQSWSFGTPHLSFLCLRTAGEFAGIVERASDAEKTALSLTDGCFIAEAATVEAEYHLERGEFDRAEYCLAKLECIGGDQRNLPTAICAGFIRARLSFVRGRTNNAAGGLMELRPRAEASVLSQNSESLDLALGYINALVGYHQSAPAWLQVDVSPHSKSMGLRNPLLFTVHGKLLLAIGEYTRLETIARTMRMRFIEHDSLLGRIHAKVFEALCALHFGGTKKALEPLAEAIELSRPDRLVLPVAEYGRLVVPILRELIKRCPGDELPECMHSLACSIRYPASRTSEGGEKEKSVLAVREQEAMRLVTRGMTNARISATMGIAVPTVKALLASAYAKLGVSNRARAALAFTMFYGKNRR